MAITGCHGWDGPRRAWPGSQRQRPRWAGSLRVGRLQRWRATRRCDLDPRRGRAASDRLHAHQPIQTRVRPCDADLELRDPAAMLPVEERQQPDLGRLVPSRLGCTSSVAPTSTGPEPERDCARTPLLEQRDPRPGAFRLVMGMALRSDGGEAPTPPAELLPPTSRPSDGGVQRHAQLRGVGRLRRAERRRMADGCPRAWRGSADRAKAGGCVCAGYGMCRKRDAHNSAAARARL